MFGLNIATHAKDYKKSFNAYASSNAYNRNESFLVITEQGDLPPQPSFGKRISSELHKSNSPDDHLPILRLHTPPTTIKYLYITAEAVATILVRLDQYKSADPYELHSSLFCLSSTFIVTPLADILAHSINKGVIPDAGGRPS